MIHNGVPVASSKLLMDRELGVDAMNDNMKKIMISSRNRCRQQFLFLPNMRGIVFFLALAFLCDTANSFSLIDDDSSSSCSTAGQKTCIVLRDEKWNTVGKEIANELSLPSYLETDLEDESEFTHGLCIMDYQSTYAVALQDLQSSDAQRSSSKGKRRQSAATKKKKKKNLSQPFFIDFCPPTNSKLGKRFGGQSGTDLLVKAVAPNKISSSGSCAFVYDLTAGFGQDSVMLAQSGANVHMVERDPIVYTLLKDALRRLRLVAARSDGGGDSEGILEEKDSTRVQRASTLLEKLSLENGEAYQVCQKTNRDLVTASSDTGICQPDICYLDPMFPPRTKSAAVKKNMQLLHGLLDTQVEQGQEEDNSSHYSAEKDLLEAAYAIAQSRVVVKRPINAPPLGKNIALKPSYDIRGKVNRWDVYVK